MDIAESLKRELQAIQNWCPGFGLRFDEVETKYTIKGPKIGTKENLVTVHKNLNTWVCFAPVYKDQNTFEELQSQFNDQRIKKDPPDGYYSPSHWKWPDRNKEAFVKVESDNDIQLVKQIICKQARTRRDKN